MYFFPPLTASASTAETYTSALDDLKKDKNFDVNNYPSNLESNNIKVIHIGEGKDGELYIYTYQPGNATKHYKANYISMSLQSVTDKNISYKKYSLTWLNSEGVFDKYIVNGFSRTSDTYRNYTISAIYRLYDKNVDSSSASVAIDTVQCKAFPVGQTWCVYYYNNQLIYEMETMEYVTYTNWATGSIRYTDGFKLYVDDCDSHYIAFSVDNFDVDKIYDADIVFTVETYGQAMISGVTLPPELQSTDKDVYKTLTDIDTGSNTGDGLFGKKYTWSRICSVEDFKKEVQDDTNDTFSKEELEGLNKSEFVFRFLETDRSVIVNGTSAVTYYSIVSEIGILRLHFLAEGKVYNLGAVGDFVGTDSRPEADVTIGDNIQNTFEENPWWQKIIALLLLLIVIVVIMNVIFPVVRPIFKIAVQGLFYIIDALLTILIYPFKLMFRNLLK